MPEKLITQSQNDTLTLLFDKNVLDKDMVTDNF